LSTIPDWLRISACTRSRPPGSTPSASRSSFTGSSSGSRSVIVAFAGSSGVGGAGGRGGGTAPCTSVPPALCAAGGAPFPASGGLGAGS
jgi:hypothetical protein